MCLHAICRFEDAFVCTVFVLFVVDGDLNGLTKMALHSINLTTCRIECSESKMLQLQQSLFRGQLFGR